MKKARFFSIMALILAIMILVILVIVGQIKNCAYHEKLRCSSEACRRVALLGKTAFEAYVDTGDCKYFIVGVEALNQYIAIYQAHPQHQATFLNYLYSAKGRLSAQKSYMQDNNWALLIDAFALLETDPLDNDALFMFELFGNPDGYS